MKCDRVGNFNSLLFLQAVVSCGNAMSLFSRKLSSIILLLVLVVCASAYAKPAIGIADALFSSGEYEKALVAYEQAEQETPQGFHIQDRIRQCKVSLGLWVDPIRDGGLALNVPRVDSLPKLSSDSLIRKAQQLVDATDYPSALHILTPLLAQRANDTMVANMYRDVLDRSAAARDAFLNRGNQFLFQGQYSRALQEFRKAEYYGPGDLYVQSRINAVLDFAKREHEYFLEQFHAADKSHDYERAWRILDEAVRLYPYDSTLQAIYQQQNESRQALLTAQIALGEKAIHQKRFEDAHKLFSELLDIFPDDPVVRRWEAQTRLEQEVQIARRQVDSLRVVLADQMTHQKYVEAGRSLREMRQLMPLVQPEIHVDTMESVQLRILRGQYTQMLELGRAQCQGKNYQSCLATLAQAASYFPEESEPRQLMDKARAEWAQSQQADRDRVIRLEVLAETHDYPGVYATGLGFTSDEALNARIRKVIDIVKRAEIRNAALATKPVADPKQVADLMNQGLQFYRQGDYPKAQQAWMNVLALDPENQQAASYLENVKRKLKVQ